MKKVIGSLVLLSLAFAQDVMSLRSGAVIEGEFDISSGDRTSLRFKANDSGEWRWYHIDQVYIVQSSNGTLLYPHGVVVNKESKRFHLSNVKHLPPEVNRSFYESISDAEKAGYVPCPACFDRRPAISEYQLEQWLVRSTIIAFQNTHEILYDHPELTQLRSSVNKVLSDWPESLKGYDYRVQVYRDEVPNALAIGGGNLYVSSGLLEMIENDAELEAVLAHEIGHIERRHTLRQFQEYRKKQSSALLVAVLAGVVVVAAGGGAEDVATTMQITALIGDFAVELAMKGYSREMEQEADIMAQLYLNESHLPRNTMVTVLDKLATLTTTRGRILQEVSAFSDHPSLIARIDQVENAEVFRYDQPLELSATPSKRMELEPGFVRLLIRYIFRAPSSSSPEEELLYLVGTVVNQHSTLSFRIDGLQLNFFDSIGITALEGISGKTVPFGTKADVTAIIKVKKNQSPKVMIALEKKTVLPYSISLSAIVLRPGKEAKQVAEFSSIQCALLIQ